MKIQRKCAIWTFEVAWKIFQPSCCTENADVTQKPVIELNICTADEYTDQTSSDVIR